MAMLSLAGLDAEELVKRVIASNARLGGALNMALEQQLTSVIDRANAVSRDPKKTMITIHEQLSADEQLTIERLYPEFNFDFRLNVYKTHGVASASRTIEYKNILQRLGYSRAAVNDNSDYDCYICDIGGNIAYHVLENNVGIHCDCPVIDKRDSVRFFSKIKRLRTYISDHSNVPFMTEKDQEVLDACRTVVASANDNVADCDVYCRRKSQDCSRTAVYGMMVHSNYDISPRQLADIMVRKKMQMVMGTFIFVPEMFIQPTGKISVLGARYIIDSDADTITFMFEGCSSYNYVHKLSRYLSYSTDQVVANSDCSEYFMLELLENRGGVQYFQMVRIVDDAPSGNLQHCLWFESLKNKTVVRYHRIDYDRIATRSKKNTMPVISCIVDSKLVDRILSQSVMATENKFKPIEIFAFIHAYCGRIFMGSDIVVRHEPLTHDQNMMLAFAVYIEVYKQKYDCGKILQKILDDIQYDRVMCTKGVLSKVYICFKALFYGTKGELFYDNSNNACASLSAYLNAWLWRMVRSDTGGMPYLQKATDFMVFKGSKLTMRDRYNIVRNRVWAIMSTKERVEVRRYMSEKALLPKKIAAELSFDYDTFLRNCVRDSFGVNVVEKTSPTRADDSVFSCLDESMVDAIVDCAGGVCWTVSELYSGYCSRGVPGPPDITLAKAWRNCEKEVTYSQWVKYCTDLVTSLFSMDESRVSAFGCMMFVGNVFDTMATMGNVPENSIEVLLTGEFSFKHRILSAAFSNVRFRRFTIPVEGVFMSNVSTAKYGLIFVDFWSVLRDVVPPYNNRYAAIDALMVRTAFSVKNGGVVIYLLKDIRDSWSEYLAINRYFYNVTVVQCGNFPASVFLVCRGVRRNNIRDLKNEIMHSYNCLLEFLFDIDGNERDVPVGEEAFDYFGVDAYDYFVFMNDASDYSVDKISLSDRALATCGNISSLQDDGAEDDGLVTNGLLAQISYLRSIHTRLADNPWFKVDTISQRSFVSRGGYKLLEIVSLLGSFTQGDVLDIGAAPGGFLQAFDRYAVAHNWMRNLYYAVTLPASEGVGMTDFKVESFKPVYIFEDFIRGDFLNKIRNLYSVRTILVDAALDMHGGGDYSKKHHYIVRGVYKFIRGQRKVLNRGITLVLKIFVPMSGCVGDYDMDVCRLASMFSVRHAYRLKSTKQTSTEAYLVCSGLTDVVERIDGWWTDTKSYLVSEIYNDAVALRKGIFKDSADLREQMVRKVLCLGSSDSEGDFSDVEDAEWCSAVSYLSTSDMYSAGDANVSISTTVSLSSSGVSSMSTAVENAEYGVELGRVVEINGYATDSKCRAIVTKCFAETRCGDLHPDGVSGRVINTAVVDDNLSKKEDSVGVMASLDCGDCCRDESIPLRCRYVVHDNSVDRRLVKVLGDGNCLYYALMGGMDNSVPTLKERITSERVKDIDTDVFDMFVSDIMSDTFGGYSAILLYSKYYNAEVRSYTVEDGDVVVYDMYKPVKPYDRRHLHLCNEHYSIVNTCGKALVPDTNRYFAFNFNRIDHMKIISILQNDPEFSDYGDIQYLMSFEEMPRRLVYFNSSLFRCHLHSACSNYQLDSLITYVIEKGVRSVVYAAVDLVFDYSAIVDAFRGLNWKVQLLNIPEAFEQNCILLYMTASAYCNEKVAVEVMLGEAERHNKRCVICRGRRTMSKSWCNDLVSVRYFCDASSGKKVVRLVDEFPAHCFKFAVVLRSTGPLVDNIMNVDGVYTLMLQADSTGFRPLRNDRNLEVMKRLFDTYVIDSSMIGLYVNLDCDYTYVVDFLLERFDTVYCVKTNAGCATFERAYTSGYFKPMYVPNTGYTEMVKNAMIEVRELHRVTESAIASNIRIIHAQISSMKRSILEAARGDGSLTSICKLARPDYGLIDLSLGKWVYKPLINTLGMYQYGWDGEKFINIEKCFDEAGDLIPGLRSGLVSVSRETALMNSNVIYENLQAYDVSSLNIDFEVSVIGGVPGCGKTHEILMSHKVDRANQKHLVLTSSTEAVGDIRKRVSKLLGIEETDRFLFDTYRTFDSLLMHYPKSGRKTYDVVFVDEGLMRHCGEIFWCAVLVGAKEVYVYGDKCQIPFINRVAGVQNLRYASLEVFGDYIKTQFRSVSRRIPVDAAVMLNRMGCYEKKVQTTNPVTRSIEIRKINNIAQLDVDNYKDFVFLCYTQAEKADLAKLHVVTRVFTVHEFQGSESKYIYLVRCGKKNEIYNSKPHQLTALSRHTKKLIYATTEALDDPLYKFLSNRVTATELREASFKGGYLRYDGKVVSGRYTQYPLSNIFPKPEGLMDIVKQPRDIRELVQRHASANIIPARPRVEEVSVASVERVVIPTYGISNPIRVLQNFYDQVFAAMGYAVDKFDAEIYESEEVYFCTTDMRITDTLGANRRKYDSLTPVLHTACPRAQRQTQKNMIKSFMDRNGCVPELSTVSDEKKMAEMLRDAFVDTFVADHDLLAYFSERPITINFESIDQWLHTQPQQVRDMVFSDEDHTILMKELDKYNYILKALPKPKLELGADYKNPSPQTIAHMDKLVNSIFCPIVREIKRRILSVLNMDTVIYTDMDPSELEKILDYRLSEGRLRSYTNMLEIDISKYDKSQGRIALLYEIEMLRIFGFPLDWLSTWAYMHITARLSSPVAGVLARVAFQRKSGDAMTFLGNTLFLMGVMAFSFDLKRSFSLFSGDDSLVFSTKPLETVGTAQFIANTFNLECKFFKFATPYFCSKFMFIDSSGRWTIIPDVIKVITKLGRRDLKNFSHVEEYRISLRDNLVHLGNEALYPYIDECMHDRYYLSEYSNLTMVYRALWTVINDSDVFRSLYYLADGDILDPRVTSSVLEF